jgi:hypothetical protein
LADEPGQMMQGKTPESARSAEFGPDKMGVLYATVSDDHKIIIVIMVTWAG